MEDVDKGTRGGCCYGNEREGVAKGTRGRASITGKEGGCC